MRAEILMVAFLCTNIELMKRETKQTIPFTIATKKKVPRNKFNQGSKRPVLGKL